MMAEDGGLGVMHPATALMLVSLVGGMVSVTGWGDGQCYNDFCSTYYPL